LEIQQDKIWKKTTGGNEMSKSGPKANDKKLKKRLT